MVLGFGSWHSRVEPKRVETHVSRASQAVGLQLTTGGNMATRRKYADGDVRHSNDVPQAPPLSRSPLLNYPSPDWTNPKVDAKTIAEVALWFALRDDGYLRQIPDGEHEEVFLKWKFTSGKHPNHYVMAKCTVDQLGMGYWLLRRKVQEVDIGARKPTIDRYYGSD